MKELAIASLVPLAIGAGLFVRRSAAARRILAFALVAGGLAAAAIGVHLLVFGAFTTMERDTLGGALAHAFLGAAMPEELFKVTLLFFILRREARRAPLEPLTAALAGLAVGLGFASIENAYYALMGGMRVDMVRLFTAMPCHACLGMISGYYLGFAMSEKSPSLYAKAWLIPIVGHGLYNLPLVMDLAPMPWTSPSDDLLLSCMVLLWLVAWSRMLLVRLSPLSAFSPE